MKRRDFLQAGSVFSLPFLIGGMPVSAFTRSSLESFINEESDRILVLIQLNGGNDGLNMVIPLETYGNLANHRSNIIIPESELLDIDDKQAFHPEMTGLKSVYENGKLCIVHDVAYPDQNRSHFRSTDIWTSGSAANQFESTGWLGRHFYQNHAAYPEGYPNNDYPDPFALTIGSFVSETCQGPGSNFSLALSDPNSIFELSETENNSIDLDTYYGCELLYLIETIKQTNAYGDAILANYEAGNNISTLYPDNSRLAYQLKIVAKLISGGAKTKVYVVTLGGFDTHANQSEENDPKSGNHAELLRTLSDAIYAFQDDIDLLGYGEKVVGMTFSEFGRRIKSNISLGTDHGTAAPLLVFGNCVNPGFLGDAPNIPDSVTNSEGVAMQHDFRSVYASLLIDWFEVEESVVSDLLFEDFQYLPIFKSCSATPTYNDRVEMELDLYPNPVRNFAHLSFTTENERVKISVFDAIGAEIKLISNRLFTADRHKISFETRSFEPGTYYVRVQAGNVQKTKRMVKVD